MPFILLYSRFSNAFEKIILEFQTVQISLRSQNYGKDGNGIQDPSLLREKKKKKIGFNYSDNSDPC